MARDSKYGFVEISGIPDDEPVFILRAQDQLALSTITYYSETASRLNCPGEFAEGLDRVHSEFHSWQLKNKERVKMPD
jgi:hypothetical protein